MYFCLLSCLQYIGMLWLKFEYIYGHLPFLEFQAPFWGFLIQAKLGQEQGIGMIVALRPIDPWSLNPFIMCIFWCLMSAGFSYNHGLYV